MEDELIAVIPAMRAYARALTRSRVHADDLVQDALERALRHRQSFITGSSLKAWVFRILRNKFTDDMRAGRRVVEDVNGEFAAQLSVPPEQVWSLYYSDLFNAIGVLSAPTREAVLMVMVAGLTHEEAALACDCPLGTLKSRVRRARATLLDTVDLPSRRPPPSTPVG